MSNPLALNFSLAINSSPLWNVFHICLITSDTSGESELFTFLYNLGFERRQWDLYQMSISVVSMSTCAGVKEREVSVSHFRQYFMRYKRLHA
jgi:hypothetical protein